jgi:haloacetate dehalogenase
MSANHNANSGNPVMFDGFSRRQIAANGVEINLVLSGHGPAVLCLHGYPQTHACWHRVAPLLARHFTVVCPDLRGYGESDKPAGGPDHRTYAKRTMARDQFAVMHSLGFEGFAVVGHDRGGRVALRMALDDPAAVSHLALLDIVPTRTMYEAVNQERASDAWRYYFLTQPPDLPERMIGADPEFYLRWTLDHWCKTPGALTAEAMAEYQRCFTPATIHATCEDYRAGATVDLEDDKADQDRRIACPLLVLWSTTGLGRMFDVAAIWRERASGSFHGAALDCGHFLAEERPDETTAALLSFLEPPRAT